jgi:hypothetical protein
VTSGCTLEDNFSSCTAVIHEISLFLGYSYYAASNDNPLPTFQDNISVPCSRVKKFDFLTLEDGSINH